MPYLTNYHLREQQADALLGPVVATLAELERRTRHYAARLAMSSVDRDAVRAAERALAAARAEVERIRQASAADSATSGSRAAGV
jgi:hypothetical protein